MPARDDRPAALPAACQQRRSVPRSPPGRVAWAPAAVVRRRGRRKPDLPRDAPRRGPNRRRSRFRACGRRSSDARGRDRAGPAARAASSPRGRAVRRWSGAVPGGGRRCDVDRRRPAARPSSHRRWAAPIGRRAWTRCGPSCSGDRFRWMSRRGTHPTRRCGPTRPWPTGPWRAPGTNCSRHCANHRADRSTSARTRTDGRSTWLTMLRAERSDSRTRAENARNAPPAKPGRCVPRSKSGDVLLSQGITPQVPSALTGLTSVFEMGTGVTLSLWSPKSVVNEGGSLKDSRASTSVFKPSPRPISTGRLSVLPRLHLRPINVMVSSRALLR